MVHPTGQTHAGAGRQAVVLLSGGLDSYTTAAIARSQGYACAALTLAYGQRHDHEITCARRIAEELGLHPHKILDLDLAAFGGSALLGHGQVPQNGPDPNIIPSTYVPARNTILLALALAWAETLDAFDIFLGVNAVDYSGYPDCRPEFLQAFEKTANLGTRAAIENRGRFHIHAPLLTLTKAQIIRRGVALGLDYALTHSCYAPDAQGRPCGRCDSCVLRRRGFDQAGVKDPLPYLHSPPLEP